MDERFVVVTTDKDRRGVFSGVLVKHEGDVVELKNARMCVYWSEATRGVLGLASIGPQKGSKISPCIPGITLNGVTSIMDTTSPARLLWEEEPWA